MADKMRIAVVTGGRSGLRGSTVLAVPARGDFSGRVPRDKPGVKTRVADGTALGHAGLPNDIGQVIVSLPSEDNRWACARRIEVSGGMMG